MRARKKMKLSEGSSYHHPTPPRRSPRLNPILTDQGVNNSGPHPLLQEPVLKILFGHIPDSDIPKIRQVCETWRDSALKVWGDTRTLKLVKAFGKGGVSLINQDRNFVENWSNRKKPAAAYKHVELKFWVFRTNFEKNPEKIIFQEENKNVNHLVLRRCVFERNSVFIKLILSWFPNIITLTLDGCSFYINHFTNETNDDINPVTLKKPDFSQHLHLTHVKLYIGECNVRYMSKDRYIPHVEMLLYFPGIASYDVKCDFAGLDIVGLLDAIEKVRNVDPSRPPVKKLNILNNINLDEVAWKKIKKLEIAMDRIFVPSRTSDQELKGIIQTHKTCLSSLSVSCYRELVHRNWSRLPFDCQLPNLKKIEMSEKCCRSLEYLQYMPNLQELQVHPNYWSTDNRVSKLVSNVPQHQMTDLKLQNLHTLYFHYKMSTRDFIRFADWVPNLQNLTMQISNPMFVVICDKYGSKMKKLKFLKSKLTDEVLIGPRRGRERGTGQVIAPNITMLTDLRVLDAGNVTFSEKTVRVGFLQMRKLEMLYYLDCFRMGRDLQRQLKDRNIKLAREI